MKEVDKNSKGEYVPVAEFYQITGLILGRSHRVFRQSTDYETARQTYYKVQKHNLLFGWWSIYALIINPVYMIGNIINLLTYRSHVDEYMESPGEFDQKYRVVMARKQKNSNYAKYFLYVILGFFAVIAGILVIASII